MRKVLVLIFCVVSAPLAQAQNWSGIIAPSRAENWGANAGLPATLPDGETTSSPWQPPTRSTICSTISTSNFAGMSSSSYVSPTALNNALSSCPAGQAVYVNPGNYYFSNDILLHNSVTLRLDPGTTIFFNGGNSIIFNSNGNAFNNATWSAGYAQGATSITLSSNSGLVAGKSVLTLYQCDDSFSGVPNCGSGGWSDNGGVTVCAVQPTCSLDSAGPAQAQNQVVLVTGISGSGPYNLTISPGLYMSNWSAARTPFASGGGGTYGMGVEGGTINGVNQTSGILVGISNTYAGWIVGTRFIGGSNNEIQLGNGAKNTLIMSCYFYTSVNLQTLPESININQDSDSLIMNNIFQIGPGPYAEGGASGDVVAYNYARDGYSNSGNETFMGNVTVGHDPGESFFLWEGNQLASIQDDSAHGSHNLDTTFRNLISADDPPYPTSSSVVARMEGGYARFMNDIGNVLGSGNVSAYLVTANSGGGNPVFSVGAWANGPTDSLAATTAMRWGNYDTVTKAARWCGNSSDPGWSTTCGSASEVPTSLSSNAAPFQNPVPSSTTLPASFFMPVTAHPSGGTGLSWWAVCTNYPTCSATQSQPFPPIGPDVTSGSVIGGYNYAGHAYDIPAAVAWKTLPIDTTYQSSYTITGSSWSGGTETLTVSGLPNTPKGEFQISSGNCAGTYVMNNSDASHVMYAEPSNPGSCTAGTFKFPDVRQFGGAVYESDGGGSSSVAAPTNLLVVVQ